MTRQEAVTHRNNCDQIARIVMDDIVATLSYDIHALRLEYKTTCDALEHWRGGDPTEQEFLIWKKDQLFRSLLEQSYENAEA